MSPVAPRHHCKREPPLARYPVASEPLARDSCSGETGQTVVDSLPTPQYNIQLDCLLSKREAPIYRYRYSLPIFVDE